MNEKQKRRVLTKAVSALLAASLVPTVSAAEIANALTPVAIVQEAEVQQTEQALNLAVYAQASLQAQIDNAVEGQVTTLTLQGETSEDLTIPAGKIIVLNLAEGSKLTNKTKTHTITNYGTLTIEGTGTVDNISHQRAAVYNAKGGVVTMNGGTYTRSKEAGKDKTDSGENSYYNIQNHGEMTINDGVTVKQTGNFSSMIASGFYDGTKETTNPKLVINGGTFSGGMNTIKNDDRGILEIHGGTFTNVSQAVLMNWNEAAITGGSFEANADAEAVVYNGYLNDAMDCGKLTISGGTFTATGSSPVIQQNGNQGIGTVQINDGTFKTGDGKIISVGAGKNTDVTIVKGSFTTSNADYMDALKEYVDPSSNFDVDKGTVSAIPAEQAAASVGEKNYKTLSDAINAAQNGETVVLKQDVTESVRIPVGKEITLDLAGKNIQNAASSSHAVIVLGKLTVKDSTAMTAPQVNGNTVTYASGKITAEGFALCAIQGGEIIVESGSFESTKGNGVGVQGNFDPSGADMNSKVTIQGGYILAQEVAALVHGHKAVLNVDGGVLQAKDNAVVSGNGTKKDGDNRGGTTINISGGTMIGGIQTPNFIACGVYHPQEGTLNITGGKFQITNGVGVLIRAGSANITGGEIVTTGSVNGWVGDQKIDEGCHGVVYDSVSNYPGADAADKITVGGGVKIVTDNGNAPVKMHRPADSTENHIEVTGGSFSAPVDLEYLKGLNAELNTGKGDTPYSYYTDVDAAKDAAKKLGGGTVTDLKATSTTKFTLTLKFEDGATADQTITVAENGIFVLPTPTREGRWAFVHWTDGTTTYAAGDTYTVTAAATLTAVWENTERTITLKYDDGATQDRAITAAVNDVITLPTPTRSGRYTFQHWTDGTNNYAGGSNYTVTENTTLTAVWHYTSSGSSSSSTVTPGALITISRPQHGSVTSSAGSSAIPGSNVMLTVTPDRGYELGSLSVRDSRGSELLLTNLGGGKYSFTMPAGSVQVDASFRKVTSASFVDVLPGSYYYDAVRWAVENDITSGTSDDLFSPDAACTRAQVITFLWRATGSPQPVSRSNPFTDVPSNAYYRDAVLWAVEQGITNGVSATRFDPDATVTRGQTVAFLYRAAGRPSVSGSSVFHDVDAGAYYEDAVTWAYQKDITGGTSSSQFSPDTACTRAQIVTFLYRAQ